MKADTLFLVIASPPFTPVRHESEGLSCSHWDAFRCRANRFSLRVKHESHTERRFTRLPVPLRTRGKSLSFASQITLLFNYVESSLTLSDRSNSHPNPEARDSRSENFCPSRQWRPLFVAPDHGCSISCRCHILWTRSHSQVTSLLPESHARVSLSPAVVPNPTSGDGGRKNSGSPFELISFL